MRRFSVLCGWLLAVFLCTTVAAQIRKPSTPAGIVGQVRLENDAAAPNGVMVLLERYDAGVAAQTQTDSQGKFQFHGLDKMPYKLTVRLTGYETSQTEVDLQYVSQAYVQIKLKPVPGAVHKLPAKGAGEVVSAQDAQIPSAAVSEFDKGKKLLMEDKNPGKAIPHLSKATHIYDKFTQAHVLLGVAYGAEKKWLEATSAFNKAIATDANSVPAYVALGSMQNNEKDFSGAEKSLLKAVQLDPASADAHLELARTYWATGRWQEADPHAARVVQLRPDHPGGHVIMGNILLRKRDDGGALKEFREALRLAPESPLAPSIREVVQKIEAAMKNPKS